MHAEVVAKEEQREAEAATMQRGEEDQSYWPWETRVESEEKSQETAQEKSRKRFKSPGLRRKEAQERGKHPVRMHACVCE